MTWVCCIQALDKVDLIHTSSELLFHWTGSTLPNISRIRGVYLASKICCPCVYLQRETALVNEFLILQEALFELRCRISEFNVCIPYSGVGTTTRVEPLLLTALTSLLPGPPSLGGSLPHPSPGQAIQNIELLHCLQRLVSSTFVASALVTSTSKLSPFVFRNVVSRGPSCRCN